MIPSSDFLTDMRLLGLDLYTGVPCSYLQPLINYVIDHEGANYVPLNNEGEAVAFACGAYLAGRQPVVMFQNSGLGNTVNPLTSLNYPFRIPLLLICTWRAQPGIKDEPQHELMGQITADLFSTMRVKSFVLPDDPEPFREILSKAVKTSRVSEYPTALILPKDVVEPYDLLASSTGCHQPGGSLAPPEYGKPEVERFDIVRCVCDRVGEDHPILGTTGKTGRELFTCRDSENHRYVVGSMGCASSIALGLSMNLPETQKVIVLDGDGAVLMRLEAMVSVGHLHPANLIHIVLDNNVHDSTGGQQTLSGSVALDRVAQDCGYANSVSVCTLAGFERALDQAMLSKGPSFIHARILPGSLADLGRPTIAPHEVKERFMSFLTSSKANG